MKIKWIGKYDGNNLPTVDVGTVCKRTAGSNKQVCNHTYSDCSFVCLLCFISKQTYLGGVAFSRVDWMIGLVIALLFFPVHELIHAVSFPAGSEVIMFYTTQGLGTTCTSPMTRNRFIVVNMLPIANFRCCSANCIYDCSTHLCFCKRCSLCFQPCSCGDWVC